MDVRSLAVATRQAVSLALVELLGACTPEDAARHGALADGPLQEAAHPSACAPPLADADPLGSPRPAPPAGTTTVMLPHRLQLPRLVAGRTAQIHLTGGLAQARLALGRGPSLATGPMACPSMLQGGCLELDSPVLWGASPTDDDGWATVSVTVPATVPPGTSVALQAVEHDPTGAQAPAVHAAEALSVAPAGSPHVLGHLTPFPDASSHAPGFLLGGAVQVPDPVTLTDLGVYALAAGVQGQLALYADAGGAPGDLVAHTAPFSTTPGQMSAAVVSPASLSPGTYWVMGVYDAPMSLGIDFHNDEPVHYVPHTLGQPLPDPFPEGLDYDGQAFNHHLRVY